MDFLKEIEFWLSIFAFFGQIGVLFLVRRMIRFAAKYGKPWAFAFKVFFAAMSICLLRRVAILLWTLGVDGGFKEAIIWYDRYISNPILTCLYLLFLILLVRWWKFFFGSLVGLITGRENNVGKREEVAKNREDTVTKREDVVRLREIKLVEGEKLIVIELKNAEIEKPKIVVIEGQTLSVRGAGKILIEKE